MQMRTGVGCIMLLVALLFFMTMDTYASNDITVRFYNQHELVAGNYTVFCQDREGFLWIGTDVGLIRFDGSHCDTFRNDENNPVSISDNKVFSIATDSRGLLWVGTVNGLNCYDSETDTFRLVELPGLSLNGFISDIVELPDGRMLFLVGGVGIFTIDINDSDRGDKGLMARRLKFGFQDDNEITKVLGMSDGRIVFSARSGLIYSWKLGGKVKLIAKLPANVRHMSLENDRSLIASTPNEVFRIDIEAGSKVRLKSENGEEMKISAIHSANGVTYFSTAENELWEIMEGSDIMVRSQIRKSYSTDTSMSKIGCLFMDRKGNLWMGCNHEGLAIAPSSKGPFVNKSLSHLLAGANGAEVTCMKVMGKEIVLGLNNGDVLLLSPDGGVRKACVSRGNYITSIAIAKNGKILIGVVREGILCMDPFSLQVSRLVAPSAPFTGVVISVGEKGEVIAAFSELGVLRYDPVSRDEKWFYPVGGSNILPCFYYSGISTSGDGKIWICGYSGIACYDPQVDSLIPVDQNPFIKGVVYDICDYSHGVLIATDRGLINYSIGKGVIRKYTMTDGLPDNDVRTILRDTKGTTWIGTMRGLACLRDSMSGIQTYGGNGMLARTSYMFSDKLIQSGQVVIGNYQNLTLFCPDSVKPSTFGVPVSITGMYLNGKRLSADSHIGNKRIVEGSLACPDVLHLSHKDNSLVVRLSPLDFRDPSVVGYEWQFEGEDNVWHSTSPGESFIYLPPLESGKHMLRIRGVENDVRSEVTELRLDVSAPWYLSDMAYVSYVILAMVMAVLVYKVVKNKREEELYESKIKFFMDISHELRSPVTLMLSPVETLLKQKHSPETTSQLLTVRRNGLRVLNLVDQLLDIRTIEKGKMRLVFSDVDIKAFVEELVDMFRPMAGEKEQSLEFSCEEKHLWGQADCDNLDKILVNLISNAIKYTPEGGKVNVDLRKSTDSTGNQCFCVTVTDTGIGLDNKVISHLFERFYRNREFHHGYASGFGIGLDLCMRLVELHNGTLTANNREDGVKGSVFSVTLPFHPAKPENKSQTVMTKHRPLPDIVSGSINSGKQPKSGHRFKVMVVDDDEEMREYLKRCLGNSYNVHALPDAETALKELGDKLPDLIVTDIRMDGIDGLSFLRRIKSNMETQHIPVILFSASADSDERVKGWKSGAEGYLAKPFTIEELEGMISGLLSTRDKLKGKFSGAQETASNIMAPKVKGMDEELMDRINKYINDNLSENDMNVDSLSEYVGLSRSQLHRRMKDIIGVAPSDYIRNVKLRKACEMLSKGDVDIAQVAYSLGFNAQSHFSTLFKRYTGMTPTEYRTAGKDGIARRESDRNENGG